MKPNELEEIEKRLHTYSCVGARADVLHLATEVRHLRKMLRHCTSQLTAESLNESGRITAALAALSRLGKVEAAKRAMEAYDSMRVRNQANGFSMGVAAMREHIAHEVGSRCGSWVIREDSSRLGCGQCSNCTLAESIRSIPGPSYEEGT